MSIDEKKLGEILCKNFGLSPTNLDLALQWQRDRGGWLADILTEMRAVSEDAVLKAIKLIHGDLAEGAERRGADRVAAPHNFSICLGDRSDRWQSKLVDISPGGVGILDQKELRFATTISIELASPGGSELKCSARVCYARAHHRPGHFAIGLQYVGLSLGEQMVAAALAAEARRFARDVDDVKLA